MARRMSAARGPIVHMVSAGGVVYRVDGGILEVLLCGRTQPLLWALPKGTPNPGETLEQTAEREVTEETGVEVRTIGSLGKIQYWFTRSDDGARCNKVVHYYLMEPLGGDTSQHDHEFDVVRWFPTGEASRLLTYPTERTILERAVAAVNDFGGGGASVPARAHTGGAG